MALKLFGLLLLFLFSFRLSIAFPEMQFVRNLLFESFPRLARHPATRLASGFIKFMGFVQDQSHAIFIESIVVDSIELYA